MRFPKERIRFATLYEGHSAPDGYLVLDLKGLDIEGVTKLVLEMADIEAARSAGDKQADAKKRVLEMLGE